MQKHIILYLMILSRKNMFPFHSIHLDTFINLIKVSDFRCTPQEIYVFLYNFIN